jgi:antitoxin component YwqK of YwqJK toxin-antitoxin module
MQLEYWKQGTLQNIGDLLNKDGRVLDKGSFKDGNGLRKSYHENDALSAVGKYTNGVPEGEWKYYHDNGNLSGIGSYRNGLKEAQWKFYYPSGKLDAVGNYKENQMRGNWTFYKENGEIKEEKNMDDEL